MTAWFERQPERWRTEQAVAGRLMTRVRCYATDGLAEILGALSVTSEHGHEYGPFSVSIRYPQNFPRQSTLPNVYLLSHRDRWEQGLDSHIERDWRLCLFVPGEAEINFRDPSSLVQLIAVTRLFLVKECFYQKALLRSRFGGPPAVWPGKDRSHGLAGIREAIESIGTPAPNDACVCGSGKLFKRCCRPLLDSRSTS